MSRWVRPSVCPSVIVGNVFTLWYIHTNIHIYIKMCLFQKTKELKGSTKYQKNFLTSRPKHKKKQQQLQQPHEAAEKKDVVEQQIFF